MGMKMLTGRSTTKKCLRIMKGKRLRKRLSRKRKESSNNLKISSPLTSRMKMPRSKMTLAGP